MKNIFLAFVLLSSFSVSAASPNLSWLEEALEKGFGYSDMNCDIGSGPEETFVCSREVIDNAIVCNEELEVVMKEFSLQISKELKLTNCGSL